MSINKSNVSLRNDSTSGYNNVTDGDGISETQDNTSKKEIVTAIEDVTPSPSALTDGASIAMDLGSKEFELKTLTTTNTAITLTLSNVVAGACQILSVNKNTASNVVITLAGTGLTFYGYDSADYNTTPQLTLSGASGDIFDITFLARQATEIGVTLQSAGN